MARRCKECIEDIFEEKRNDLKMQAEYLLHLGVPAKTVSALDKNSGLSGNALGDMIYYMGHWKKFCEWRTKKYGK